MESLIHLPLERYKERYTENLADWEKKVFSDYFEYEAIGFHDQATDEGDFVALNIRTGEVLDSMQRPVYCMKQILRLMKRLPITRRIYFSDFYTTGLDAIAYAKRNDRPKMSAFLWAQTFDRYDFTQSMIDWMRPWEIMAFELYSKVFVASPVLKDLIVAALPHTESKIEVVGLPFNSEAILADVDHSSIEPNKYDVIYTSRWDFEKNPNDFLNLVEYRPDVQFCISSGATELRGSDTAAIHRVRKMLDEVENLTCFLGISKAIYHALLASSKVQFNCALQDWISFTLLEALAYECAPLYPNFRSFPEALMHSSRNLYAPGNIKDASAKLDELLADQTFAERHEILSYHDGTLHRIANSIQGDSL
jgi:glycosyltransferase involved in cell wall biosynthesis